MIESLLADAVLVGHLGFIAFAALGGLAAVRFRWAPILHLPCVAWGAYVEATGRVCPLTPLENALRRAAREGAYSGGFVEHYLVPVVYPDALTRGDQLVLALGLVGLNVVIYAWVVIRRARRVAP